MSQIRFHSTPSKPPKPEEITFRFSERAVRELEAILKHYPDKKSATLPALWIAQREYGGYLPPEALCEVALRLGRSYAEVEGVATFYTMYHVGRPVGKHLIEVCTCLTCMICGAYRVADVLKAKLGIDWGETTPDGLFTLEEVECLDACDRAPVLMIGERYAGPVTEEDLEKLLDELRNTAESTVINLADAVVRAHLSHRET